MKQYMVTNWRSLAAVGALLFLIAAGGLYAARRLVGAAFEAEYQRFHSVQLGMTEGQVRLLLGGPYRRYRSGTAPTSYYVPGYSYEERSITNEVLIYVGKEAIAYVYLDRENRVEHLFVGGS